MNAARYYIRELWRDTLCAALMILGLALFLFGHYEWSALCFLNGWAFDPQLKRPRLKPNQAIVTAPVEASAEMRQAALAVTEIRSALMAAGFTSQQAAEQIAAMIAAQNGGQS